MTDIQIFMCCHAKFDTVPPLAVPIQCGASINPSIKNAIPDNKGSNISEKNREYCELTAHYYVWKNINANYYGFCHYRRFFCISGGSKIKRPYLALGRLTNKYKHLLGSEEQINKLCEKYDIIAPKAEDMGISAGEHYLTSKFHYGEDLDSFMNILAEQAPKLLDCAEKYLAQNKQYFCNMFIMDKTHFFEYCEILFSVLGEFDSVKNRHIDFQSDRTDGYLGEIFTGIYITYAKEKGAAVKELPRIDINCTISKRIAYKLFPPETKRRFIIKKAVKSLVNKNV